MRLQSKHDLCHVFFFFILLIDYLKRIGVLLKSLLSGPCLLDCKIDKLRGATVAELLAAVARLECHLSKIR